MLIAVNKNYFHSSIIPLRTVMGIPSIFVGPCDAASVDVKISSPNVLNGTSIKMTAAYDPTLGNHFFKELECGYTNPGAILFKSMILKHPALTAAESARLTITSTGNPMILEISPIIFADEKRSFYCVLHYYDRDGNSFHVDSQKITLDNVYCK